MDKMERNIYANQIVRPNRVTELKPQIKTGEYEVDLQKLAGKMLLESLQLDHRQSINR